MRANDVYFTSDTHLFHAKLLEERGFSTLDEMHETIIRNWNNVVKRGDEVWHLGDFSLGKVEPTKEILRQLNGKIHFIKGNHDSVADKLKDEFTSYQYYKHLNIYDNDRESRQRIILSHYSFQVWDSSHHGSWNLYGHSHGSLPERRGFKACDIGVDSWNFTPVKYEQIRDKFDDEFYKYYEAIDHHNKNTN